MSCRSASAPFTTFEYLLNGATLGQFVFVGVSLFYKHNVTRIVRAEEKDDEDYISHFVDSI